MNPQTVPVPATSRSYAGQAVYTSEFLRIYDQFVLGFSNRFIYRCPTSDIVALYDRHVSDRHLDIGPGTGYFLDHCRFPSDSPEITLVDLNPDVLSYCARRLRRYAPRTIQADILQPLPLAMGSVDSIGLNYVLHCLPGSMREKAGMFSGLAALLAPGGVLFGSTALGQGVTYGRMGRSAVRTYNRRGILCNSEDSLADLQDELRAAFGDVQVRVRGTVAVFVARR
jgi:SAM-dependent methyltransferase